MKIYKYSVLFTLMTCMIACNKKEFLDADPFMNLSTISTLADCRSLLNNQLLFNETPVLGEITSGDYFVTDKLWELLNKQERNAYSWQVDIFEGQTKIRDYAIPYQQVNIANEILAALAAIPVSEKEKNEKTDIEGSAYFIRAYAFYNLLQIFARPFDGPKATQDTGIALPLKPDVNMDFYRATMQESYNQVISDLQQARRLLKEDVQPDHPSKPAAEALLARVYLTMRNYSEAGYYANSCLQFYNKLMDFNLLSTPELPISGQNVEILYYSYMSESKIIQARRGFECIIAPDLYATYSPNDLRKDIFYKLNNNQPYLKASYTGRTLVFSGLATDEMYLIRAEYKARENDVQGALEDLNTLLVKRYKTGTFIPMTGSSKEEVLELVLTERRKELAFRGLRFTDLRRLNKEGADIWLSREANNQHYQLPPDDLRYTLPIPEDAIHNSHISQNKRQ